MGQSLFSPVDVPDTELLFDAAETRQILKFFWPHQSAALDALSITSNIRRFAQQLLIAAIDASYAMGFIEILATSVVRRGALDVKKLGKRLAQRFLRHWWKHATEKDLMDVKIYESVRAKIAVNFRTAMEEYLAGTNASVRLSPVHLAGLEHSFCWG